MVGEYCFVGFFLDHVYFDEDVVLFVGGKNCIAGGVRVVVVVLGRLRLGGSESASNFSSMSFCGFVTLRKMLGYRFHCESRP